MHFYKICCPSISNICNEMFIIRLHFQVFLNFLLFFRTSRLKKKLQPKYPSLRFHEPTKRSESEIVFAENLETGTLLENVQLLSAESESDSLPLNTNDSVSFSYPQIVSISYTVLQ